MDIKNEIEPKVDWWLIGKIIIILVAVLAFIVWLIGKLSKPTFQASGSLIKSMIKF